MTLLVSYLRHYQNRVMAALLLAAVSQVFYFLDPLILRYAIDEYATRHSQYTTREFFRGVVPLLGMVAAVTLVGRTAKSVQDYVVSQITLRVGAELYADGVRHTLQIPYVLFEEQRSGETLGRLQKVRRDIEKLLAAAINVGVSSLVGTIFVVIYAVSLHPAIAPIYLVALFAIVCLNMLLGGRIKALQETIVAESASLAGATTESLRNIELVKSLGLDEQEIARLNGTTDKIAQLELRKVRYVRSLGLIHGTAVNTLRMAVLSVTLYLVFARAITIGQFFALGSYLFLIFAPLHELGNTINLFREAEVSLKHFQDLLRTPKELRPARPTRLDELRRLSLDRVTFQHPSAPSPALNEISFEAERGDTIAVVGPSGAGKTTLVKLLVGLYRPQMGEIRYNGHLASDIDLKELRARVGVVTQDAQLFSGTLRENLLLVNPAATDAECLEVLQEAACQRLLARSINGLDTVIGEGGVKLSGGEKQRLSIARALLRRPDLLIFDEATSSLDSLTEAEIAEAIRDVRTRNNAIVIVVAHRLSTIMHANPIVVLERGRIVERGSHDELLARKGLYDAMWRLQLGVLPIGAQGDLCRASDLSRMNIERAPRPRHSSSVPR